MSFEYLDNVMEIDGVNYYRFEASPPDVAKTLEAVLVNVEDDQVWIPLSLLREEEYDACGDLTSFYIPVWFAEQEELI